MKKQVIIYVDVPDDAPTEDTGGESLGSLIEQEVEDNLPPAIYVTKSDDDSDDVEVALTWGGVTVRDA